MKLCKNLLPIALLVLIGSLSTAPAEASCSAGSCVLVWEDEFDGTSVDPLKWEFENGNGCQYGQNLCGWGNNEQQYYRPENAVVANGELTITAKQESFGGADYTSARLRTKGLAEWTYGRFEMRARLPVGQGMWPAFWMLPSASPSPYGTWASSGEIDIMETVGNEPARIHGTIHYGGAFPDNDSFGTSYNLPANNPTDFHVYAVEWEEGEIRWYVDGVLYSTRSSTQWWSAGSSSSEAPFDVDFHLLLNLAVGGNWPGDPDPSVLPQNYVIDYVRVYQTDNNEPPKRVFDDMEHGNPFANGWFIFDGSVGGGGLNANGTDLPPANGGSTSLQASWGSGGTPGYFGGFGRTNQLDIAGNLSEFRMWINPDADQDYILGINLQEDDNSDGAEDEEFQFDCVISPIGPCAIAGGGWQLVTIPLDSFVDDNSFLNGGNGILDAVSPANGGNGELINIVTTVVSNSGADVTFRTDYWSFYGEPPDIDADDDGVDDVSDNCTNVSNPAQEDSDGDGHGNICDGDFDQDCSVAFLDLSIFNAGFFGSDALLDLDSDGMVAFLDLAIFKGLFFGTPGPSTAGALCN